MFSLNFCKKFYSKQFTELKIEYSYVRKYKLITKERNFKNFKYTVQSITTRFQTVIWSYI